MIDSVNRGSSWYQLQSPALYAQPAGFAGGNGRSVLSGPPARNEAKPGASPLAPQLTPQEQKEVEKLKQRDREVKAHEQAHKAQLGPYAAGGPFYTYKTGPDNNQYAVGGSVGVDTSKESTPEETIRKAQIIKRASMGVSNPSGADKAVAAKAQQMEQQARTEMLEEKRQERGVSRELGAYQQAGSVKDAAQSLNIVV